MFRVPMPLIYAGRNALARKTSTAVTTLAISISVMVFLVMSATAAGIAAVATSTGSPSNLLMLAAGAASAELSFLDRSALYRARELPGLARDARGEPLTSPELVVPRRVRRGDAPESAAGRFVLVRGVTPAALQVHDGLELASGSYPDDPDEILVGELLARTLGTTRIGDTLWVGSRRYRVSGTLRAEGQIFAGELWVDLDGLRSATGQRGASSLILRVDDVRDVPRLAGELERGRGLRVSARPEPDYYRDLQQVALPVVALGNTIAFILGLGAVMAGMNTMYAAMSRRTRELATLRALGFGRWYVAGTLLLESVLIAAAAGALGTALAFTFDGIAINLLGLAFELRVQSESLARGAVLALAIGALGGLLPARAAFTLRIHAALRAS
jgi:putative ABC transport system permease protein